MGNPTPSAALFQTIDASDLAKTVEALDPCAPATTKPPASGATTLASSVPPTSNEQEEKPGETSRQPTRIGRYILLKPLGEGAMGVVFAAYDEELDRKVAVKILHPSSQSDDQLRNRILREAQALARVSSPNVIHVYQVGEMGGQIFIAMEFINGTTLSKWQAESGRSWQEILRMYTAAGQGLLAAHQAGLVHRDFKPDNVLIGKDGWPRVADFGLARIESKSNAGAPTDDSSMAVVVNANATKLPLPALTQAGVVMGTLKTLTTVLMKTLTAHGNVVKVAVGYVRVSTLEQASEGVSLDAQRDKLCSNCKFNGIKLIDIVADEGLSGSTLERPGLQTALQMLRRGRANTLLVIKLDRLTRSVRDLCLLVDDYFGHERYHLLSVCGMVNTHNAVGRMLMLNLANFAQFERESISERTYEAMQHLKAQGVKMGHPPYGYVYAQVLDDGGRRTVKPLPSEQTVIDRMASLLGTGLGFADIARHLTAEGIRTGGAASGAGV